MITEGFYWFLNNIETDTINGVSVSEFLGENPECEIYYDENGNPSLTSPQDMAISINGGSITGGGTFGGVHPPIPTRPK